MSLTLPDLPYPYDALAPYMSRETLEYHHDKHHLAYVNNANNLLKGPEWAGKSLEEIVTGSFGKNVGLFNNAAQHYNHTHFWKWMKKGGGGDKLPAKLAAAVDKDLGGIAKAKAAGVYKGRPPSIEASRVREMKAQGMRPVDIAKALQIGRASVYRVLGQKAVH